MANELNINLPSFAFLKNGIAINVTPVPAPLQVNVTGLHSVHDQVVLSSASDTNIPKGNIGTIGYVYVRNMDAVQTITLGYDGTTYVLNLKPGDVGVFRWNSAAFHAKASVGTPTLEYMLIED